MIANANYNSSPTAFTGYGEEGTCYETGYCPDMNRNCSSCGDGSKGPSISFRNFDAPINLFKEDEFLPEEVCKKSIQMESKRFVPSVVTRINRGRG